MGEATWLCHPGGGPGGVLGEAIGCCGGDAGHAIGVGGVFGKVVELRRSSSGVCGPCLNLLLGGGVIEVIRKRRSADSGVTGPDLLALPLFGVELFGLLPLLGLPCGVRGALEDADLDVVVSCSVTSSSRSDRRGLEPLDPLGPS